MSEIIIKPQAKHKGLILGIVILVIALLFWGCQSLVSYYKPVDSRDKTKVEVVIPAQSNARQIAAILSQQKLIRSERAFLYYCRHNKLDNRLQSGHYRFSRSQSLPQIASIIAQGRVVGISFTIPEGYTVKQIGDLLVKKNICSRDEWNEAITASHDFEFLKGAPVNTKNELEGFLFPDTYDISEDTTANQIVNLMLSNFEHHWKEQFADKARSKGMSLYDTVILASIIEREAQRDNERRLISGVIQNRLKTGMLLQLCPTVLYCIGQPEKDNVTYQDLQIDSPYNTYKHPGLPPGPISCPGAASIAAALNPEKTDYYYYVAKGDGSHYFSRTYSEHLQAQRRYSKPTK